MSSQIRLALRLRTWPERVTVPTHLLARSRSTTKAADAKLPPRWRHHKGKTVRKEGRPNSDCKLADGARGGSNARDTRRPTWTGGNYRERSRTRLRRSLHMSLPGWLKSCVTCSRPLHCLATFGLIFWHSLRGIRRLKVLREGWQVGA